MRPTLKRLLSRWLIDHEWLEENSTDSELRKLLRGARERAEARDIPRKSLYAATLLGCLTIIVLLWAKVVLLH
jgi:hypothetical protein